ncbi:MP domain-containing protein, partial [Cephalotus follicularis]
LVQITLKPLTRIGLNNSLIICLRDCRHNKFTRSLLGLVESSLSNDPIYFNCFSNFIVSLNEPNILKTLTINLKTFGLDMLHGSQNLVLINTIHYKVMTRVSPNAKIMDTKGETILFHINTEKINIAIPKPIKWNEIIIQKNGFYIQNHLQKY